MKKLLVTLCFLAVTWFCAAEDIPFDKCPSEHALSGKAAAVRLELRRAREFRTVLRQAAAEGPNFNGHYKVVYWGCGTECIEWAIINLESGEVWFPSRRGVLACSPDLSEEEEANRPDWIETKLNSSLLVLNACEDYKNQHVFDTRYLYQWQDGDLHLISKSSIP